VVAISRGRRIAAPQTGLDEHEPVADVLHLVEGGLPREPQALVARAPTVPPRATGVRLDALAQVEEGLDQLPHLHVAHVALRVPHRGRVVEPVENHLRAATYA